MTAVWVVLVTVAVGCVAALVIRRTGDQDTVGFARWIHPQDNLSSSALFAEVEQITRRTAAHLVSATLSEAQRLSSARVPVTSVALADDGPYTLLCFADGTVLSAMLDTRTRTALGSLIGTEGHTVVIDRLIGRHTTTFICSDGTANTTVLYDTPALLIHTGC